MYRLLKLLTSIVRNRRGLVPRPSWCTWLVLYRCNARCPMCDSWRLKPGSELSPDDADRVFRKIGPLQVVRLTGGEPFLREDLPELADIVMRRSNPVVLHITTNGSFPERIEQFAQNFSAPRRLQILLSVDGLEHEHNRSRGRDVLFSSVEECVRRLQPLRRRGLTVSINHTITTMQSLEDHSTLQQHMQKLGAEVHAVIAYSESAMYSLKRVGTKATDLISPDGYPLHPGLTPGPVLEFVEEQIRNTLHSGSWAAFAKRYYWLGLHSRLQGTRGTIRQPRCVALRSHLRLLPDGSVPVCQFNTEKVGNLREQSFAEVWHSRTTAEARQWVDRCRGCWAECEVLPSAIFTGSLLTHALREFWNPADATKQKHRGKQQRTPGTVDPSDITAA